MLAPPKRGRAVVPQMYRFTGPVPPRPAPPRGSCGKGCRHPNATRQSTASRALKPLKDPPPGREHSTTAGGTSRNYFAWPPSRAHYPRLEFEKLAGSALGPGGALCTGLAAAQCSPRWRIARAARAARANAIFMEIYAGRLSSPGAALALRYGNFTRRCAALPRDAPLDVTPPGGAAAGGCPTPPATHPRGLAPPADETSGLDRPVPNTSTPATRRQVSPPPVRKFAIRAE